MSNAKYENQNGSFLADIFGKDIANRNKINQELRNSKTANVKLDAEKENLGFIDYAERAASHCIGLPINLNFDNFVTWVIENSKDVSKPAFFRLYIEKGFSDTDLDKVKKVIFDNFSKSNIFITEIHNVSSQDIEKIDEFVMTFFFDQQVL